MTKAGITIARLQELAGMERHSPTCRCTDCSIQAWAKALLAIVPKRWAEDHPDARITSVMAGDVEDTAN